MIVIFKKPPTAGEINRIKAAYLFAGLHDSIQIRKCSECDGVVQLWEAPGIETFISAEGVKAGSGGRARGAGEDSLASYSFNYLSSLPLDSTIRPYEIDSIGENVNVNTNGRGKDTIVIAVLDTGVDTALIDQAFLWRNPLERVDNTDNDKNCRIDDWKGWNFINGTGTADIQDDNAGLHGTFVSQYIINEFLSSSINFVQVMTLKTHNSGGVADLFNTICAIHYAINNGAKIINASWGFYNQQTDPLPYLDSLITEVLPTRGILFFAAAGNKIPGDNNLANRNLEVNSFYPACLSKKDNNVITVTTTDTIKVSPTQNYSARYVDLGVKADSFTATHMYFLQPFRSTASHRYYLSGSSFATPIACGKIGAYFKKSHYMAGVKKSVFLNNTSVPGIFFTSNSLKTKGLIRDGKFVLHLQ